MESENNQNSFIPIFSSDFVRKAAMDETINFIAFVITPWHAISLDASIAYLQNTGVQLKGMVLVFPHSRTGVCVKDDSFLRDCYTVYIEDKGSSCQNNLPTIPSTKKEEKLFSFFKRRRAHWDFYKYVFFGGRNVEHLKEMYVMDVMYTEPNVGIVLRSNGRYARYVCYDEGIGSYFTPDADIRPTTYNLRKWASFFRVSVVGHRWTKYFHNVIFTMLFNKKGDVLYPREEVLPFYSRVIERHALNSKHHVDVSNAVVIATPIYNEEKQFYNGDDVRVWKETCDLLHTLGCDVYMKPHPRDDYYKQYAKQWHCQLISGSSLSMEEMCALSKPKCVIGGTTTALVTTNLFFKIPTLCVNTLVDRSKCDRQGIRFLDQFKKIFANYIYFPNTLEEMEQSIKRNLKL